MYIRKTGRLKVSAVSGAGQFRREFLCQREKTYAVSVKEVLYIEHSGRSTYSYRKETYTTKQRLYLLKEELPQSFMVSKSVILNMEK
ncbi:MAG: LytTR family transcriptional regulator DNA-binding domain-containing protein [Blautia hansenii]